MIKETTMRELTKQEIDNAPEWATHYSITATDKVMYESEHYYKHRDNKRNKQVRGWFIEAQPIPRKEFDTKTELTSLLQMCVNDMYSPSGKIKKGTARKLMAACQKGLVNYPS